MGNWKRPDDVEFPSVWSRFEGKKPFPNGKFPRFRIQDATDEISEDILGLMLGPFVRDEPLSRSLDTAEDEQSMEEFRVMWTDCLKYKTVLACILENGEELEDDSLSRVVGCNMTVPKEPGDEHEVELVGEKSKKIFDLLIYCESQKDCFEVTGPNVVLNAMGLSVDRKFRGQGIGLELLKAREKLCAALGINATVTCFTAIASQKLAEKLNFETIFEIAYDDYKVNGEIVFPNINTKTLKYMVKIYNNKS